jgi:predicted signal transduction protein with EAL and GGDEF domain
MKKQSEQRALAVTARVRSYIHQRLQQPDAVQAQFADFRLEPRVPLNNVCLVLAAWIIAAE